MLRGSEIIGNPVITYDTGELIDKVEDFICDSNHLIALVVDKKKNRVIYMERIKTLGPDAVIVDNRNAVVESDAIYERQCVTKGLTMLTGDARELGVVRDTCIEPDGRIVGYEISSGKLADVIEGRSFVPANYIEKVGKDVVLATAEAVDAIQNQAGAIKSAVQTVTDTVQKVRGTASETVDSAKSTLSEKLRQVRTVAREKVESVQQTATQRLQKVEVTDGDEDEPVENAMETATERTRQLYEAIEKKRTELNQS